jgi:hypothetical protein
MNSALLEQLKLYHTFHSPSDDRTETFFNVIKLQTIFGDFVGYFDSEESFHYAEDGSCCLMFKTKETIQFIKIEDILKFNTEGGFTYDDKKEWQSSGKISSHESKPRIGFKK